MADYIISTKHRALFHKLITTKTNFNKDNPLYLTYLKRKCILLARETRSLGAF